MKYFTGFIADFVKYGKPTYGNKDKIYPQQWLPFQPGRGISMLIENPPRISRDFPFKSLVRPGRIQLWMDLFGHVEDIKSDYHIYHDEF